MEYRDIIVVGGSAGGLAALQVLVGRLPRDLSAAVFVVLHIGARDSALPQILAAAGPLPAAFAADDAPIEPGRIHIAPPDHHLVLSSGRTLLSRGPRENRTRPAVDPLFRSAAEAYGSRVIGVILSGTLSDGTAGFSVIKRHGGITVVQDPDDARYSGMPASALHHVTVDHCVPVGAMPELLVRLSGATSTAAGMPKPGAEKKKAKREKVAEMPNAYDLDQPVALTCPDCGGALRESSADSMLYYTCHIGHRFAGANMDAAQYDLMEQALAAALRTLNERAALCRRMAETALAGQQTFSAQSWDAAYQEATDRAEVLRRFLEQEWTKPSAAEEEDG